MEKEEITELDRSSGKGAGRRREIDMIHGSLWDKILLFALPLALTGMLQQLFNAADIAVLGQFAGKDAMAAVGSVGPLVGLLINLFVGISVGSNVVISRFTGMRNGPQVKRAVHTTLLVGLIAGLSVMVVGELIAAPMLRLISVPDEIMDMALLYVRIFFLGLPVTAIYNFEAAIFRSQGDTRTPLICLSISGVINVALNIIFVVGLGMDVEGVAIATVTANLVSAVMLFVLLGRHSGDIRLERSSARIDAAITREIFRIGLPAGLQGMVFSISNICIQSQLNTLGPDVIAGSSAAFNIEIFCFFILNSFGQAATTFIGQNYGAGDLDRCRRVTRICLLQDVILTFAMSMLILLTGHALLHIFNADPSVIAAGYTRITIICMFQWVNSVIEVISGVLRGYGYSLIPALTALIGICGVRIIYVYTIFPAKRTFFNLLIAYPVSWGITLAAITIVYLLFRKRVLTK